MVKTNRRNFMALMGGLALAAPHIELPTPLPELSLDVFADDDRPVWINGQPLRGVREIDWHDDFFALFGGVRKYVYYRLEGPFRSTVYLRGIGTEEVYQGFYHLIEHHYYEPMDVLLLYVPEMGGKVRLRHQQMTLEGISDVYSAWKVEHLPFDYRYEADKPPPLLAADIAERAWGIYLEFISKKPYDLWQWEADNPSGIEYKRCNPHYVSARMD